MSVLTIPTHEAINEYHEAHDPITHFTLEQLGASYLGNAVSYLEIFQNGSHEFTILEGLVASQVQTLISYLHVFNVPAMTSFIAEHAVDQFAVLVLEGQVEISKRDKVGQRTTLAMIDAGQMIGEMALIDDTPRFSSCTAIEDTKIAVFSKTQLQRLESEEPQIACKILQNLLTLLAGRLRQTSEKLMEYINTENAMQRR